VIDLRRCLPTGRPPGELGQSWPQASSRPESCPTDRPVAGDDDVDAAGHVLEESQRGEVVLHRIGGAAQVEHWNQDVGEHVAGDENAEFLDQQRRMARGMCLMLDNSDFRAVPRDSCRPGGQT